MLVALIVTAALAAAVSPVPERQPEDPKEKPKQLVSEVVDNELKTQDNDHSLWRYKQVRRPGEHTEEVEFVETPKGSLYRVLSRDGQPLNPAEEKKENERIDQVLQNPEAVVKREKEAEKDGREERDLLKMLPAAFDFRYAGRKDGLLKVDFTPNPSFKPQRREGDVFHHMTGTILIDASKKRLVEIDGRLSSDVKFWGGILGHLDKGGTFEVNQQDVGDGHWEMTRLFVNMNGKALLFKTINVHQNQEDSDFQPVRQDITLKEAAELLKKSSPQAPRASERSSFR